jgi:hypothetical protein
MVGLEPTLRGKTGTGTRNTGASPLLANDDSPYMSGRNDNAWGKASSPNAEYSIWSLDPPYALRESR